MRRAPLGALALGAALALAAAARGEQPAATPPAAAAGFLAEVEPLLTAAEREAYLQLGRPYQREAFERRFWQVRDPFPETPVNEFAVRWRERAPEALTRWGSLADARALAFAAAGPPLSTLRVTCPDLLLPAEIWSYENVGRLRGGFAVVFVAEAMSERSRYRAWNPREGALSLATASAAGSRSAGQLLSSVAAACGRGEQIASMIQLAVDWDAVVQRAQLLPHPNDEWVRTFASLSTDLPPGATPLPAEVEIRFAGRRGLRVVSQGAIRLVDPAAAPSTLTLDGEILRGEELFDHFRYRYQTAAAASTPLLFERPLRPGSYRLILRLHEEEGERYFRDERDLVVPAEALAAAPTSLPPAPAAGAGAAAAAPLPAATDAAASTEPGVRILVPGNDLLTGKLRVEALPRGEGVAAVAFTLDGRPVMTKKRPPFGAELDLGRTPRLHRIGAIALDAAGVELGRDEALVNGGPHRFAVRLVEPQNIPDGADRVEARATVDLPEGESLDRIEFHVNDTLYATLYQEPFTQALPLPRGARVAWIRVVAFLADGGAAEDVRMVGAGEMTTAIDVDFVELYASVLDRRGRFVEGLGAGDVEVLENRKPQEIRRFEPVADLPIHAGVLLDTSASMAEELGEAERAAQRFFAEVLTDRDRACVLTFADEPRLAVRFTRSPEVLAGGLAGLEARGETKLWDAVAFALHYFSGIRGKRAVVLLTDGLDSGSKFKFEEVLEYARRTGVAIYIVGLDVPVHPPDVGMLIDRLARETGGRSFRISRAVELGPVYREIQRELRAQYLIAYQSDATGEAFREIEVRVKRPGVEVRTVRGYYP